jgi:hypothetical protein
MSQEESAILQEGVPYVKIYRYNPKHLCPKLNGNGDNGHWEDQDVGGCTILKGILESYDGMVWIELIWLRIGTSGGLL